MAKSAKMRKYVRPGIYVTGEGRRGMPVKIKEISFASTARHVSGGFLQEYGLLIDVSDLPRGIKRIRFSIVR